MAILSIGELLGIGPDQLSGFVPYTAVEGSGGLISGINGSGLSGAGTDTTAVSAIASSYATSAASGKVDQSAFDACCSSVQSSLSALESAVSGKQDTLSFSGDNSAISYINGSAISAGDSFEGVYHDNTLTGSGLSYDPLGVNKMELIFDSASLTQTVSGSSATVAVRCPVCLVSASADATAQGVVYIVTGSP